MTEPASYQALTVPTLKDAVRYFGLSTTGNKDALVKRLGDRGASDDKIFDSLFSQWVPREGIIPTRQGKLLRAVDTLIYQYDNSGISFIDTITDNPTPFRDAKEDTAVWQPYLGVGTRSNMTPVQLAEDRLQIAELVADTIARVEKITGKEATAPRQPAPTRAIAIPPTAPVLAPSRTPAPGFRVYVGIVEQLDPRQIIQVVIDPDTETLRAKIRQTIPEYNPNQSAQYLTTNDGHLAKITTYSETF